MPTDMQFAQRLRECRTAAGLSQRDLSRATNIQPANLCHYEAGTHVPSFENLRVIAKAINASTDYLLGLTDAALGGDYARGYWDAMTKVFKVAASEPRLTPSQQ